MTAVALKNWRWSKVSPLGHHAVGAFFDRRGPYGVLIAENSDPIGMNRSKRLALSTHREQYDMQLIAALGRSFSGAYCLARLIRRRNRSLHHGPHHSAARWQSQWV